MTNTTEITKRGRQMTHPISSKGNYDEGTLDIKIGGKYVLTVELGELNQNSNEYQKHLYKNLIDAVEDSFKLGREYEKNRIKNFLDK